MHVVYPKVHFSWPLFAVSARYYSHPKRNRRQWICEILDVNNRTDISFFYGLLSVPLVKSRAIIIFNINATCAFYYLLHLLKVLCLKCDSKLKDHHFNSWILILILSFGPSTQNLLWYIICNFGFKIQPVDRLFLLQVKRTYFERHVHQKLAFLTQKLAHVWIQSIHK